MLSRSYKFSNRTWQRQSNAATGKLYVYDLGVSCIFTNACNSIVATRLGFITLAGTDVVIVRMRVQDNNVEIGQLVHNVPHISDAKACIKHQREIVSHNRKRNHLLELSGLIDGVNFVIDSINLKPIATDRNFVESTPFGPGRRVPLVVFISAAILNLIIVDDRWIAVA